MNSSKLYTGNPLSGGERKTYQKPNFKSNVNSVINKENNQNLSSRFAPKHLAKDSVDEQPKAKPKTTKKPLKESPGTKLQEIYAAKNKIFAEADEFKLEEAVESPRKTSNNHKRKLGHNSTRDEVRPLQPQAAASKRARHNDKKGSATGGNKLALMPMEADFFGNDFGVDRLQDSLPPEDEFFHVSLNALNTSSIDETQPKEISLAVSPVKDLKFESPKLTASPTNHNNSNHSNPINGKPLFALPGESEFEQFDQFDEVPLPTLPPSPEQPPRQSEQSEAARVTSLRASMTPSTSKRSVSDMVRELHSQQQLKRDEKRRMSTESDSKRQTTAVTSEHDGEVAKSCESESKGVESELPAVPILQGDANQPAHEKNASEEVMEEEPPVTRVQKGRKATGKQTKRKPVNNKRKNARGKSTEKSEEELVEEMPEEKDQAIEPEVGIVNQEPEGVIEAIRTEAALEGIEEEAKMELEGPAEIAIVEDNILESEVPAMEPELIEEPACLEANEESVEADEDEESDLKPQPKKARRPPRATQKPKKASPPKQATQQKQSPRALPARFAKLLDDSEGLLQRVRGAEKEITEELARKKRC